MSENTSVVSFFQFTPIVAVLAVLVSITLGVWFHHRYNQLETKINDIGQGVNTLLNNQKTTIERLELNVRTLTDKLNRLQSLVKTNVTKLINRIEDITEDSADINQRLSEIEALMVKDGKMPPQRNNTRVNFQEPVTRPMRPRQATRNNRGKKPATRNSDLINMDDDDDNINDDLNGLEEE